MIVILYTIRQQQRQIYRFLPIYNLGRPCSMSLTLGLKLSFRNVIVIILIIAGQLTNVGYPASDDLRADHLRSFKLCQ